MRQGIAALVLAAGSSTRYGVHNKLTEPFRGKALVAHSVDAALEAGLDPVHVVTGNDPEAVRQALAGRKVSFVFHPDHAHGMGSSLAAGTRSIGAVEGLAILLGDMPWIRASHVKRLAEAFAAQDAARRPKTIYLPTFEGRRGHPVLFGSAHHAALATLTGDRGARPLVETAASRVVEVPMADDAVLRDIDRGADWPPDERP